MVMEAESRENLRCLENMRPSSSLVTYESAACSALGRTCGAKDTAGLLGVWVPDLLPPPDVFFAAFWSASFLWKAFSRSCSLRSDCCIRAMLSGVRAHGWNTCFPMHDAPANFLVIRMGSQ